MKFAPPIVFLTYMLTATYPAYCDEDLFSLSLEDLLQVSLTGASLREQTIRDAPASVTVFNTESFKQLGAQKLSDLLRFVPGFQQLYFDQAAGISPVVRGRSLAPTSREYLFIVDGVRMDSWIEGANITRLLRFPLIGVKRVEFIRGPVSHMYGSNAYMGVINIVTGTSGSKIRLASGQPADMQLTLSHPFKLGTSKHHLSFEIFNDQGLSHEVPDPFNPEETLPLKDQLNSKSLSYTIELGNWRISARGHQAEASGFYVGGRLDPEFSDLRYSIASINLENTQTIFGDSENQVMLGSKQYKSSTEAIFAGAGSLNDLSNPASNDPLWVIYRYAGSEQWLIDRLTLNTKSGWTYQMGYEFRYIDTTNMELYNNYDVEAFVNQDFPIPYFGHFDEKTIIGDVETEYSHGIYAQSSYNWGDKLESTLGIRYDNSKLAGDNISPRISFIYFPTSDHSLKLIYGEAFRAPAANEYFTKNNPALIGNPDLKAETVATTELIWVYENNLRHLQLSFFYNDFKNTITSVNPDGSRRFNNSGESSNSGAEITLALPISRDKRWSIRANLSKLFDMPEDTFRLSNAQANLLLNYKHTKWNLSLDYEYSSERRYLMRGNTQPTPIDAYGLVNAHFSYKLTPQWKLTLSGKNLFDKAYAYPSVGSSLNPIPARGREYVLGIERHF
ncbi:TonB-dependent receptor plug domain-containing protein [Teredinibacter franksiae]|uniref:TonB-dependent receptor plug domain-containing protein n=1 Tax=Teredinibacter franksiae TaxID=2761453 RepID=UPI0016286C4B|nr:TonB-dependent receptor [Teredinibacter franksiae]